MEVHSQSADFVLPFRLQPVQQLVTRGIQGIENPLGEGHPLWRPSNEVAGLDHLDVVIAQDKSARDPFQQGHRFVWLRTGEDGIPEEDGRIRIALFVENRPERFSVSVHIADDQDLHSRSLTQPRRPSPAIRASDRSALLSRSARQILPHSALERPFAH